MLLQAISAHTFMYLFATNHKFNNRALSTLGIERCYSDLSIIEITGSGCPKSYQVPKLISILKEYNTVKHDTTKLFPMDKRRVFPILLDLWNSWVHKMNQIMEALPHYSVVTVLITDYI